MVSAFVLAEKRHGAPAFAGATDVVDRDERGLTLLSALSSMSCGSTPVGMRVPDVCQRQALSKLPFFAFLRVILFFSALSACRVSGTSTQPPM